MPNKGEEKMSSLYPPFLKWGEYTATNPEHADVLEIVPQELETFETEYSINVRATVDGADKILPLQSLESQNKQLFQLWNNGVQAGDIKTGKKFQIKTWLGLSKNKRKIRRFELVF